MLMYVWVLLGVGFILSIYLSNRWGFHNVKRLSERVVFLGNGKGYCFGSWEGVSRIVSVFYHTSVRTESEQS
jgi:hypothetical protein